MKHMAAAVLLAAVVLSAYPRIAAGQDAAAADKPCTKIDEKCQELTFKGSPILSRELFMFAPFYSEEIITTTKGVTKVTTFLTFIRVETEEPKSRSKR